MTRHNSTTALCLSKYPRWWHPCLLQQNHLIDRIQTRGSGQNIEPTECIPFDNNHIVSYKDWIYHNDHNNMVMVAVVENVLFGWIELMTSWWVSVDNLLLSRLLLLKTEKELTLAIRFVTFCTCFTAVISSLMLAHLWFNAHFAIIDEFSFLEAWVSFRRLQVICLLQKFNQSWKICV